MLRLLVTWDRYMYWDNDDCYRACTTQTQSIPVKVNQDISGSPTESQRGSQKISRVIWQLCETRHDPNFVVTVGTFVVITPEATSLHDDVIKWKHFPRYWPFVWGIHRSPMNSPHKGQWRGALMFSLICVWINGWVNNRETGDLRRNHDHYDAIVM